MSNYNFNTIMGEIKELINSREAGDAEYLGSTVNEMGCFLSFVNRQGLEYTIVVHRNGLLAINWVELDTQMGYLLMSDWGKRGDPAKIICNTISNFSKENEIYREGEKIMSRTHLHMTQYIRKHIEKVIKYDVTWSLIFVGNDPVTILSVGEQDIRILDDGDWLHRNRESRSESDYTRYGNIYKDYSPLMNYIDILHNSQQVANNMIEVLKAGISQKEECLYEVIDCEKIADFYWHCPTSGKKGHYSVEKYASDQYIVTIHIDGDGADSCGSYTTAEEAIFVAWKRTSFFYRVESEMQNIIDDAQHMGYQLANILKKFCNPVLK